MRRGLLVVPTVLLLLALPAQAEGDRDLPEAVQTAIAAGDWQIVADELREPALASDATESQLYWYGTALFHLGERRAAHGPLRRALALEPRDRATARTLARVARQLPDERAMRVALDHQPLDPVVLTQAASLFRHLAVFEEGKNEELSTRYMQEALLLGQRAVDLDPESPLARAVHGFNLVRVAGDGVLNNLHAATDLRPQGFEMFLFLGAAWDGIREAERSLGAYEAAREARIGHAGRIETRSGGNPAVLRATALRAQAATVFADQHRAKQLTRLGRHREALEVYRYLLERWPGLPEARWQMAVAAWQVGDHATAIDMARQTYEHGAVEGYKLNGLELMARCAYEMGQDKLALQLMDRAFAELRIGLRVPPEKAIRFHAEWHFTRGRTLWQLGRRQEATEELYLAIDIRLEDEIGNREMMEWALHALKGQGDVERILSLVGSWAVIVDLEEALAVVTGLPQHIPPARLRPYRAEMVHLTVSILDQLNRPRTAWAFIRPFALFGMELSRDQIWIAIRAGEHEMARKALEGMQEETSAAAQRVAREGLATLDLLEGRPQQAYERLAELESEARSEALFAVAAVQAGHPEVVDAMSDLDVALYGLLTRPHELGESARVTFAFPDTPLVEEEPSIRSGDLYHYYRDGLQSDGTRVLQFTRHPRGFRIYVDIAERRQELRRRAEAAREEAR